MFEGIISPKVSPEETYLWSFDVGSVSRGDILTIFLFFYYYDIIKLLVNNKSIALDVYCSVFYVIYHLCKFMKEI